MGAARGPDHQQDRNLVQLPSFTSSPLLTISEDLIYAMNNISSLVGVEWYFGLPFLNEQEIPTIIEDVSSILGTNLLGFQMANEPEIYESHGKKPAPYQIPEYMADWERVRSTYAADRTDLIAPNVCCPWTIDELLTAGFLTQFAPHLHSVSIQHYKDNACANALIPMPPQDAFLTYQTHSSAQKFWNPDINASQIINAAGKDFIMLETNTASCSRFAGGPGSYAGGLYLIDLAPQGASIGVSQIILHNGGVGQAYNLFTPPPNNQSTFRQWTTTPHYYSTLIMGEVMEEHGSQVMDLLLGGNSTHTPGYAIYKSGTPIKLALFNYIPDPSGANDAQFNFPSTQPSVRVKAGQTMGDQFGSDGRLRGEEQTQTVQCNAGTCTVTVKAPQFALVFLDNQDTIDPGLSTQTILATSNGRGGAQEAFNVGGTSSGSQVYASSAQKRVFVTGVLAGVVAMVVGAWAVLAR
ncbi:glycoside hydrolase family 79 protein [Tulasnella calospora MUT 4182]|uniref:Glycoside hydrolase family 79 protein n=1 Tax=Tulasnella calospora MUT 4182 TaxID=1051891 RepID=A0A0C3L6W1_9AGAM|nr:glycoside hydrolase family 79 protein [Tulasnella calospora MUT 4182]